MAKCRQIYEEANKTMRNCEEKEERLMLLESWRSFEDEFGTASDKERVDKLMPEKVKKRRKVQADDGVRTEPAALVLHASRAEMPKTLKCVYNAWYVYNLRTGAAAGEGASHSLAAVGTRQGMRPTQGGAPRRAGRGSSWRCWFHELSEACCFWSIRQEVEGTEASRWELIQGRLCGP